MKKRVLSLALAVLMALSLLPTAASASTGGKTADDHGGKNDPNVFYGNAEKFGDSEFMFVHRKMCPFALAVKNKVERQQDALYILP